MNIFVEYFNHKNERRKSEIDKTLITNINFNYINKFYVFSNKEDSEEVKKLNFNKKITNVITEERCTFQYIFDFANSVCGEEEINITMNNDIILSKSFSNVKIPKECFFAISRWERNNNNHPFCYRTCDSQDLWIWRGKNKMKECNFYFGILGCDNRIVHIAEECGYITRNPAYTYRCHHNHESKVRIGSNDASLRLKGPYKKVCPCH
jgi:hypothetical protein